MSLGEVLLCTKCGYEGFEDEFFTDPDGTASMELYKDPNNLTKCPECSADGEHVINADDALKAKRFFGIKSRVRRFFNS
jgi:hypothetical protein